MTAEVLLWNIFFQGSTFEILLNFCAKNPPHRQAENRYGLLLNTVYLLKSILKISILFLTTTIFAQSHQGKNISDFLPKGYVVFEKINGDLNKDGIEDSAIIVKATEKDSIIKNRFGDVVDRNRRGIIVLFNMKDHYDLVVKNNNCFSSENEDGGVYFSPELSIEIKNGNLYFHYAAGRYGYWEYTFRFQNSDFELIGYNSGDRSSFESDYVTFDETSVNFMTKKKLVKKVIKVNVDGKEVYKETWENINANTLTKLSEIKDFDELEMDKY